MNDPKICFLIDDDPDEHEIFEIALKGVSMPVQLCTATNASEILERLTLGKAIIPDYIFLDLNMPLMDGKQFLSEIKKHPVLKKIPVIIYSTSFEEKDIEETKKLGAVAYITKPARIHTLTKALSDFFVDTLIRSINKQAKKLLSKTV